MSRTVTKNKRYLEDIPKKVIYLHEYNSEPFTVGKSYKTFINDVGDVCVTDDGGVEHLVYINRDHDRMFPCFKLLQRKSD